MNLSDLSAPYGARRGRKRIGRGHGSGKGKTAGFGTKGQKSRTGHHKMARHYQGGQTPIQMQLPYKRGFKNYWRLPVYEVGLDRLAGFDAGAVVTPEMLIEHGIIRDVGMPIVVLNNGELSVPLTVHAHRFTKSAQAAIEAAGGSVQVLELSTVENPLPAGKPGGLPAPKTERKNPVNR